MHYIIYDLETTCWDDDFIRREREIIEIGALILDDYGTELSRFQSFVRPIIHPRISHYCQNLTGISSLEVEQAASFERVFFKFQNWYETYCSDCVLVSWGEFDIRILLDELQKNKMYDVVLPKDLDCKAAYRAIRNLPKRAGLLKALKLENLEFEGDHHRALDDAYNLSRLFKKFIDIWPI